MDINNISFYKNYKEFFEQSVNLENANLEIKNEAKKRILRDFSE